MRRVSAVLTSIALLAACSALRTGSQQCSAALSGQGIRHVAVPGKPFMATPGPDGCTLFVTLHADSGAALAILDVHSLAVRRVIHDPAAGSAVVVSRDGRFVVVAHEDQIAVYDATALTAGQGPALLGTIRDSLAGGFRPQGVFTPDDRHLLLVSEGAASITVVDMAGLRAGYFGADAIVGHVPIGAAPVALRISPDGKYLYSSSQGAGRLFDWPRVCRSQRPGAPREPINKPGIILVHDLKAILGNPGHGWIAAADAGCNTNRLALSPDGAVLYATVRGEDEVRAFDTRTLRTDPDRALLGRASVGKAPVGLAVVDDGAYVVVANSARFESTFLPQTLSVVDARGLDSGHGQVVKEIPAGHFPRELTLMPDGRALVLTNYASNSVQLIPVELIRPE